MIEIPGYRILRQLGRGGMAAVYLAIQESVDREVALKVMSPALLVDPNFGERFLREARIAAKLHHRNVVAVHDVGRHGDLHYIAMEYLPLGPVLTKDGSSREIAFSLRVAREIATALGYAHGKGFIHRDVKPDNILLRDDGSSALTDFGIARATDSASRMTRTGAVIGTPHYMSPEQARGKTIDGRADLYSLGVVIYELLVGRVPYQADDSLAVGIMHITEPVPQLPEQLSDLQPLLDNLLAKLPEQRHATGEIVAEAVRDFEIKLAQGQLPRLLLPSDAERREILASLADAPRTRATNAGAQPVTPGTGVPRATPPRLTPAPAPDEPATVAVRSDSVRAQSQRSPQEFVDALRPEPQLGRIDDVSTGDDRRRPTQYPEPRARRPLGVWLLVLVVLAGVGASLWLNQDRLRGLLPETELNTKLVAADAALAGDRLIGPASALELYGEALKLDPDSTHAVEGKRRVGEALVVQARKQLAVGDVSGARARADVARQILQGGAAIEEIDAALRAAGQRLDKVTELLDKARIAREAGNLVGREDSAVSFYERILDVDPGNSIAMQGLGDIITTLADRAHALVAERKYDEARAVVESIARVSPSNAVLPELQAKLADTSRQDAEELEGSLARAETFVRQGQHASALPLFRGVLAKDAGNARARTGLAQAGAALLVQANAALDASDTALADRLLRQADGAADGAAVRTAKTRLRELREKQEIALQNVVTADQQARVGVLLKEAEDAAAAGLLLDPPVDSAYDKYRAALAIDRQNAAAKAGIAGLPAKAKAQFAIAITERRNNTARGFVDTIVQLTPNDPDLPALRTRLAASWLAQADADIEGKRFENAIKAINKARELAPADPGIAAAEDRLRAARGG